MISALLDLAIDGCAGGGCPDNEDASGPTPRDDASGNVVRRADRSGRECAGDAHRGSEDVRVPLVRAGASVRGARSNAASMLAVSAR